MTEQTAWRLMRFLIGKKCTPDAPIANAQLHAWAAEAGIEEDEINGALSYAGHRGWIASGPRSSITSLTKEGWEKGNS